MTDLAGSNQANEESRAGAMGAVGEAVPWRPVTDPGDATEDRETPFPGDVIDAAETEGATDAPIFISYRLEPDEETAVALQRLLAGSFEPPAKIFVASAGDYDQTIWD